MGYWPPMSAIINREPFVNYARWADSLLAGEQREYYFTGTGICHYILLGMDHHNMQMKIEFDGQSILYLIPTFANFNADGFTKNEYMNLIEYNAGGKCQVIFGFPTGFKFEQELYVSVKNMEALPYSRQTMINCEGRNINITAVVTP